jgi:hypothetical protein
MEEDKGVNLPLTEAVSHGILLFVNHIANVSLTADSRCLTFGSDLIPEREPAEVEIPILFSVSGVLLPPGFAAVCAFSVKG